MPNKVLINGTSYSITKGKTLINGTGYSITKGKTLINGTGYDIIFSSFVFSHMDNTDQFSWASSTFSDTNTQLTANLITTTSPSVTTSPEPRAGYIFYNIPTGVPIVIKFDWTTTANYYNDLYFADSSVILKNYTPSATGSNKTLSTSLTSGNHLVAAMWCTKSNVSCQLLIRSITVNGVQVFPY